MVIIHIVAATLLVRRYLWSSGFGSAFRPLPSTPGSPKGGGSSTVARAMVPRQFTGPSIVVGFSSILLPLVVTFSIVPKHVGAPMRTPFSGIYYVPFALLHFCGLCVCVCWPLFSAVHLQFRAIAADVFVHGFQVDGNEFVYCIARNRMGAHGARSCK